MPWRQSLQENMHGAARKLDTEEEENCRASVLVE